MILGIVVLASCLIRQSMERPIGGCKDVAKELKELTDRISSDFILVRKTNLKGVDTQSIKNTPKCKFEIVYSDTDANRIPRKLPRAVCLDKNCELFCSPVSIERRVFKKQQDKNFGTYYTQSIVEEVIGFVPK